MTPSCRFACTTFLLTSLLLSPPASARLDQQVRDPKLQLAYQRLRFERLYPPEAVQAIHESVRDAERAVEALAALTNDPRTEVRMMVAMLLGELGDPEGADPLWKLIEDRQESVRWTAAGAIVRLAGFTPISASAAGLKNSDPTVRALVAGTLYKLEDNSVEAALIDALDDEDERVRMEVARALGTCGTAAAIPSLIPLLRDQSVLVRTAAAMTLGMVEDPASIPALLDAMKDPDWHVRARAIMSLSAIVKLDPSKQAQVTDAFISQLQEDEFALVRDRAADALAFAADERSIDALVRAIISENRDARFHAVRALVTARAVSALPKLMEYRHHPNPEVRQKIIEVFGAIGGENELPAVAEAVDDSHEVVRIAAVNSLRTLQKRGGVEALRRGVVDPNPYVRAAAARALGEMQDHDATPQLIAMLRDRHGFVRGAAAEALGKLGDRSAVGPLVAVLVGEQQLLGSPEEQGLVIGTENTLLPEIVRQKRIEEKIQVVQALGDLRAVEAIDAIVEHGLRADDARLRAESAISLGKIGNAKALSPLEDTVRPYYDAAVRPEEVEPGLNAGAVPETIRLLKEREARVRASVAWALGQIADPSSLEILRRAADDENSLVRDAAQEAIARILEQQERLARTRPALPTPPQSQ